MQKQHNPLKKSRLILYIALGVLTPVILFYIMVLTTDPLGNGFMGVYSQSDTQKVFMYILLFLTVISPAAAPWMAHRYFKEVEKEYLAGRKSASKRELIATKNARDDSRKNQLIILGLLIVGLLLITNAQNIAGLVSGYWYYAKDSLRESAASKKGCQKLIVYDIENSSEVAKGHYAIVSNFGYEAYNDTVSSYELRIYNSYDDCADNKITAADQTKLVSEYLAFLETTSHKLLAGNLPGLTETETANIRQMEAKNHQ